MMDIKFGTQQIPVNTVAIFQECPVCTSQQYCDLLVYSEYLHIYWIPIFPVAKNAVVICTTCNYQRTSLFTRNFILSNDIDAKKFKHPLYSYTGILATSIIIGLIILAAKIG
jgi:hypothetical protein